LIPFQIIEQFYCIVPAYAVKSDIQPYYLLFSLLTSPPLPHIYSLSLSLFEGLRGLRDAVAPDSAYQPPPDQQHQLAGDIGEALTGPTTTATTTAPDYEPDWDDFLVAYCKDEPYTLELVSKNGGKPPRTKDEYRKLRSKLEVDKHTALVSKLAQEILGKSAAVDDLVANLPGMKKTKAQQMEHIQKLMEENIATDKELKTAYEQAEKRRNEVRSALERVTCNMLGIEEGD